MRRSMRRILALASIALLAGATVGAQGDAFEPLRFLLGDWVAVDTPKGESGSFSFAAAVQGHVITRTNQATYAATADRPASRHEDLLVIASDNGTLTADYFDSEGHVIRYAVESREPNVVTFVSVPGPHEPRYRLTYRAGADGRLVGSFEIAPPGTPDRFQPYLSWTARKR